MKEELLQEVREYLCCTEFCYDKRHKDFSVEEFTLQVTTSKDADDYETKWRVDILFKDCEYFDSDSLIISEQTGDYSRPEEQLMGPLINQVIRELECSIDKFFDERAQIRKKINYHFKQIDKHTDDIMKLQEYERNI